MEDKPKTINISKILDNFKENVDIEKSYTLDELKKILSSAYKNKNKTKKTSTEKRKPSEYNIFIKNKMLEIKQNSTDLNNKDIMSKAASLWKEHKESLVKE